MAFLKDMGVFLVELKETRLRGETVYLGKILTVQKDVVTLPNGANACREVVRHNGACCVVAMDDEKNLFLVRQFRYALNKEFLELPAGKLDVIGESPLDAAKRELFEETGVKANNWIDLGTIYPSPGYCDEVIYLYVATDLIQENSLHLDEGEFLQVEKYSFDEIFEEILYGTIRDSKTICAILKLKMLMIEGKIEI